MWITLISLYLPEVIYHIPGKQELFGILQPVGSLTGPGVSCSRKKRLFPWWAEASQKQGPGPAPPGEPQVLGLDSDSKRLLWLGGSVNWTESWALFIRLLIRRDRCWKMKVVLLLGQGAPQWSSQPYTGQSPESVLQEEPGWILAGRHLGSGLSHSLSPLKEASWLAPGECLPLQAEGVLYRKWSRFHVTLPAALYPLPELPLQCLFFFLGTLVWHPWGVIPEAGGHEALSWTPHSAPRPPCHSIAYWAVLASWLLCLVLPLDHDGPRGRPWSSYSPMWLWAWHLVGL